MNDTRVNHHLGRGEAEPAPEPTEHVVARDPVTPPGDLVVSLKVSCGSGQPTSVQLKVQCDPVTPPGKPQT